MARGSKILTDDFPSYGVLKELGYVHETINHPRESMSKEKPTSIIVRIGPHF